MMKKKQYNFLNKFSGNAASSGAFTFGSDVTSNEMNSLSLNNGLLGSINGDEPNEIDPIAMEDM